MKHRFASNMGIAVVASAMLALLARPALSESSAPVIAAKPISKVPFVIKTPGHYIMKKDLALADPLGVAISIEASDVVLDLGGRVLSSSAPQDATNGSTGISTSVGAESVTVRNGTIRFFRSGVSMNNSTNVGHRVAEDLLVERCGVNGIDVRSGLTEVLRCRVFETGYQTAAGGTTGISAIGREVKVSENVVGGLVESTGGWTYGIDVVIFLSGLIERNVVSSDPGVSASKVGINCYNFNSTSAFYVVENCVSNFKTGLFFGGAGGANGKYRANLTRGCTTPFSGGTAVGTENN